MWRQPASREHTLIVAVGDKKGYLSVWQAGKTKPIFRSQVSEQQQTITDLAWSRCGYILAVSTLDGFVTAVKFDPDEIGVPLSDAEATKVRAASARRASARERARESERERASARRS
jgi:protein HIRA/HIR1